MSWRTGVWGQLVIDWQNVCKHFDTSDLAGIVEQRPSCSSLDCPDSLWPLQKMPSCLYWPLAPWISQRIEDPFAVCRSPVLCFVNWLGGAYVPVTFLATFVSVQLLLWCLNRQGWGTAEMRCAKRDVLQRSCLAGLLPVSCCLCPSVSSVLGVCSWARKKPGFLSSGPKGSEEKSRLVPISRGSSRLWGVSPYVLQWKDPLTFQIHARQLKVHEMQSLKCRSLT